jgi:ribonuclease P protein component
MRFTYNKHEKLKSEKLIKQLFDEGETISVFPLRLLYFKVNHHSNYLIQAGVTVSKRNFKKAVDRNRIKRLMREAYRLNKPFLYENIQSKYVFMFIYLDKKEVKYAGIEQKMKEIMKLFITKISKK